MQTQKKIRTSQSHPIYVDWLPLPGPGQVGMTFAPGKHAQSLYNPGIWARDLHADLDRLRNTEGTDVLVSLIQDHELAKYRIQALFDEVPKAGIELVRYPIPDGGIPRESIRPLLDDIESFRQGGRKTVIHCIGGLGRTGTVAGCLLVDHGYSAARAFETLKGLRGPNCPEHPAQRAYIEGWRHV